MSMGLWAFKTHLGINKARFIANAEFLGKKIFQNI